MNNIMGNSLQVGTVINNKWVILEFIAKGGMGEVYRAHQLNLKRDVAIKIVSKEWLQTLIDDKEELQNGLERFRNEVQAMAQAQHVNILQIYDYGTFIPPSSAGEGPLEYIVMEYVPGSTLRSTMSEEGFYPEEELTKEWILKYFIPVLDGVEALHNLGIIHRDLKPENVLVDKNVPKIADFGLAHSSSLKPVTHSADMKGTPSYMSPEQFIDFRRTDERTDIYALGKILYEAIKGKIPINTVPFKQSKLENARSSFFKGLDLIIQKATEENKERRIGSIGELRLMLQEVLNLPHLNDNEQYDRQGDKRGHPYYSATKKKLLIVSLLGGAILIMLVLWSLMKPGGPLPISPHLLNDKTKVGIPGKAQTEPSALPSIKLSGNFPETITMEDGVVVHLIPGGTVRIQGLSPESGLQTISLPSFYMEETLVTNHQYVDFLNQVLNRIRVKNSVVRANGKIWLLLGEALEGYEPIVYRNGRFHINKPAHASCPVIRVTAYGAEAYARFYGRRLPTDAEWTYALVKGGGDPMAGQRSLLHDGSEKWEDPNGMMEMMYRKPQDSNPSSSTSPEPPYFPSPVLNSGPNSLGIRGLNGSISEWGVRGTGMGRRADESETEYIILGGLRAGPKEPPEVPLPLVRKPWEAFEEVGFRTVLDVRRTGDPD